MGKQLYVQVSNIILIVQRKLYKEYFFQRGINIKNVLTCRQGKFPADFLHVYNAGDPEKFLRPGAALYTLVKLEDWPPDQGLLSIH